MTTHRTDPASAPGSGHGTAAPLRLPRAAAAALVPLVAAAVALAPAPALAHDVLTGSTPEDGDTVDTVPEEVVLTFNNAPSQGGGANAVVVTGPDGETTYEEGALAYDDADVSVGLAPLDEAGDYTIAFRVVSSDGHPIQDTLVFTVSEEAVEAAAPTGEPADDGGTAESEGAGESEEGSEDESESAPADSAAVAESAEDGVPLTAIVVLAAVALGGIGAVVLVVARLRNRTGSGPEGSADQ